jgi:hypothetical protein
MLLISKISQLQMHSAEWKAARTGRLFTSSNMHFLMGKEGFGDTGMNYIRRKVFEALSGVSTDKEIDTDAVKHGLAYEPENLRKFCQVKGVDMIVTQKMINGENENEASTPDGLIVRSKSLDSLCYDVSTIEAKCYQHDKYMKVVECETTQEVKKADPAAYFQVLHQMMVADCLNGFISYYHPDIPINSGGLRIIEFRKAEAVAGKNNLVTYPIKDDLKLMNERKRLAMIEFNRIKEKVSGIKN